MPNPWLTIPLEDYEQHMASSHVQQLAALSELFGQALGYSAPESVAILGVAGGNGLERIDPGRTRRVCAIDLNPAYLEATRQRFANLPGMELHCVDLAERFIKIPPVQLVHAALIFEHAGLDRCLENGLNMVAANGSLSVVLQLPAGNPKENINPVSGSAIETLREHFQLIEPGHLTTKLADRGYRLTQELRYPLPSGKAFWFGIFKAC